jgi:hypothetical protein
VIRSQKRSAGISPSRSVTPSARVTIPALLPERDTRIDTAFAGLAADGCLTLPVRRERTVAIEAVARGSRAPRVVVGRRGNRACSEDQGGGGKDCSHVSYFRSRAPCQVTTGRRVPAGIIHHVTCKDTATQCESALPEASDRITKTPRNVIGSHARRRASLLPDRNA